MSGLNEYKIAIPKVYEYGKKQTHLLIAKSNRLEIR